MIQCLMLDVDGVVVHPPPAGGGTWSADLPRAPGIRLEGFLSLSPI